MDLGTCSLKLDDEASLRNTEISAGLLVVNSSPGKFLSFSLSL
jgi:hypothetical protein